MGYDRIIGFRPDTALNWSNFNPILSLGEGAIESDTGVVKVGDGSTAYNDLPEVINEINYNSYTMPIGGIIPWTTAVTPTGYLLCNGNAVSRTTYSDLFNIIGEDYGVGDGSTTFNLPKSDFDSGWVSTPSANAEHTITHNLYADFTDLIIRVWGKDTGAGTVAEMNNVFNTENKSLAPMEKSGDDQAFYLQKGNNAQIIDDAGTARGIEEYKVIVIRKDMPAGSIIRATNTSVTLEAVTSATIADLVVTNSLTLNFPTAADHDTGWLLNELGGTGVGDWTNVHLGDDPTDPADNITHGLNLPLASLRVKLLISTDGTDANSFEIGFTDRNPTATYGYIVDAVDDDNFIVQTGANGISTLATNGVITVIDSEDWYYRIMVWSEYSAKGEVGDAGVKGDDGEQGPIGATGSAADGGYSTPIGSVMPWTTAVAPTGYLLCNGDAVSRTTYSDLFNIIQEDYGVGDGSTTFNVPDYRGVFLRGSGEHATMVKADGTPFDGGVVGDENDDKMQGHWHTLYTRNQLSGGGGGGDPYNTPFTHTRNDSVRDPVTDGANGTPRTGNETNPANIAVTWIIRATNISVTLEAVTSATIADLIVTNSTDFKTGVTVPVMHVQDQKATSTDSGTFTLGAWRTRDLNTVVENSISGSSLSSNQITLLAGTYKINGSAPAYYVDRHVCRFQNVTDAITVVAGRNAFSAGGNVANDSNLIGTFTIGAEKVFELQHYCSKTQATNGFGVRTLFVTEIYAEVFIEKIG